MRNVLVQCVVTLVKMGCEYLQEYIHFPVAAINPTNPNTCLRLHGSRIDEPFDDEWNNGEN